MKYAAYGFFSIALILVFMNQYTRKQKLSQEGKEKPQILHYVKVTKDQPSSSFSDAPLSQNIQDPTEQPETEEQIDSAMDQELTDIEDRTNQEVLDEIRRKTRQIYSENQIEMMWADVDRLSETEPLLALEKLTTFHNDIMLSSSSDLWMNHHEKFMNTITELQNRLPHPTTGFEAQEMDENLGVVWE